MLLAVCGQMYWVSTSLQSVSTIACSQLEMLLSPPRIWPRLLVSADVFCLSPISPVAGTDGEGPFKLGSTLVRRKSQCCPCCSYPRRTCQVQRFANRPCVRKTRYQGIRGAAHRTATCEILCQKIFCARPLCLIEEF